MEAVAEAVARICALFTVHVVNTELKRIDTLPMLVSEANVLVMLPEHELDVVTLWSSLPQKLSPNGRNVQLSPFWRSQCWM